MNRTFRSLIKTFLMAACALTLNLSSFEPAQAQDSSDGRATLSSHYGNQQRRRRPRRRAKRKSATARTGIRTTPNSNPTVYGVIQGEPDYTPPGGNTIEGTDANVPRPPLPRPTPNRRLAPINAGVLNGKAISLPKPEYPAVARAARASGRVVVQVTIDESGKVISARAVSGHPLLQAAAVQAAYGARFSPTQLSGQPVKVTGTISYNFVQ